MLEISDEVKKEMSGNTEYFRLQDQEGWAAINEVSDPGKRGRFGQVKCCRRL
jgi:hypothetical protein